MPESFLTYHKKVIPSGPKEWRFWDFTLGRNRIEEWFQELSEGAQETLTSLLKLNRKIESPANWTGLRYLKGDAKQHRIWELRFRADGREYRVLGYFGPGRKEATLLIGCYHKQNVYDPPACIETAIENKKRLEEGTATHNERKIPLDR